MTSPQLADLFMTTVKMFTLTLLSRKDMIEKIFLCWKLRENETRMENLSSLTLQNNICMLGFLVIKTFSRGRNMRTSQKLSTNYREKFFGAHKIRYH